MSASPKASSSKWSVRGEIWIKNGLKSVQTTGDAQMPQISASRQLKKIIYGSEVI